MIIIGEKMKIIKVRDCIFCPYMELLEPTHNIEDGKYICLMGSPFKGYNSIKYGITGRLLTTEEMMKIPDWCPLDDYYD